MELHYRTADGRMTVKLEGQDQKALIKELAKFQEIFEDSTECGCCGSKQIRWVVRHNAGNDFHEIWCLKCRARKTFGIHKVGGTLFPHKKDDAGEWLPNNGWARWEGRKTEEDA